MAIAPPVAASAGSAGVVLAPEAKPRVVLDLDVRGPVVRPAEGAFVEHPQKDATRAAVASRSIGPGESRQELREQQEGVGVGGFEEVGSQSPDLGPKGCVGVGSRVSRDEIGDWRSESRGESGGQVLARELFQDRMEEFVYQFGKMLAAFADTQFYLLAGVFAAVERDGITTAVIRGRDNKPSSTTAWRAGRRCGRG